MAGYFRTADPIADATRKDIEHEAWLAKQPICYECEEPIDDDGCYVIADDECYCSRCMRKKWKYFD